MIKEYIAEGQRELERTVPPLSPSNPELFARLEAAPPATAGAIWL